MAEKTRISKPDVLFKETPSFEVYDCSHTDMIIISDSSDIDGCDYIEMPYCEAIDIAKAIIERIEKTL